MTLDYIICSDGSVRLEGEEKTAAYAAVILSCKTMKYVVISDYLSTGSIQFSEAWAVYRGLCFVKKHSSKLGRVPNVLVVTDSKLTIQSLTEWCLYNWNTEDWYHWKKSDGGDVKNQSIYRKILKVSRELNVRYAHINSHTKGNKAKFNKIWNKLNDAGIELEHQHVDMLIEMNDIADKTACDLMQYVRKTKSRFHKLKWR